MNWTFLPYGFSGALLAGLISLLAGVLLPGVTRAWGRRHDWTHAHEIGWAWLGAVILTAGIDTWNLLYMGIVPMQSPVRIASILETIHDPDTLGVRVFCEFAGASAGVMLGWLLWTGLWRHPFSSRHDGS